MRQLFVCVHCGLRLSGRKRGGRIVAHDRAPDGDAPAEPCVCLACLEQTIDATTVPLTMPLADADAGRLEQRRREHVCTCVPGFPPCDGCRRNAEPLP